MGTHGKDKTGPLRDDERKKEVEGELRAGHSTRAEEWHEPEPPGEDQPEVDLAPDTTLVGGTPPGMTAEDVELRAQLARFLGRDLYPADRAAVLDALRRNHAPDRLLELAADLPEARRYRNVQDIARELGLGVEDHRT
jgi:Protein of unknown function (DUF2795)